MQVRRPVQQIEMLVVDGAAGPSEILTRHAGPLALPNRTPVANRSIEVCSGDVRDSEHFDRGVCPDHGFDDTTPYQSDMIIS